MSASTTLLSRRSKRHSTANTTLPVELPSTGTDSPNSITSKQTLGTNYNHKRKQVHFGLANNSSVDPQVDMLLIPHVQEFDEETRTNLWFTNRELDDTIQEATRTIVAMNDGVLFTDDDPDFTTRGLEYMTPTGFNIASSSQQAVTMVLAELDRQRKLPEFTGQINDDLLADSIQAISRHRQRIAHLAAMKDARTVHGQGNFRCQVIHPPADPTTTTGRGALERGGSHHEARPRSKLRASGSMDDLRRRRQIDRTSSSRRQQRHSAPVHGSDPMVPGLSCQQWRNSTSS